MRGPSLLLAMLCGGCFFGDDDGGRPGTPDADPGIDARPTPRVTVRAIRRGEVATGFVTVQVVVTAVWGDDVFIADPVEAAGDATSELGLRLVAPTDLAFDPHPISAAAGAEVEGDLVEVSGLVDGPGGFSNAYLDQPSGRAVTPVPTIALETLASAAELAPYDAMVVRVADVPIGLTSLGEELISLAGLSTGMCATSIAGLAIAGAPELVPRVAGDVDATPSATCPPYGEEWTIAQCSDGVDNDWDGWTDCQLGECEMACVMMDPNVPVTTVTAFQSAASLSSVYPKFDDVVVTAVNPRTQGGDYWELWVSDPGATTAMDGGVRALYYKWHYDFRALPVGTLVDLAASGREYTATYDGSSVTQRRLEYAFVETGSMGTVPAPALVTATQLTTTGSSWEGQLVKVENHRLASGFNPNGFGLLSDGTSTILLTTRLADLTIVPGSCLAQVTGIVIGECGNRPATNPCVELAPRTTDDVVGGGTGCP